VLQAAIIVVTPISIHPIEHVNIYDLVRALPILPSIELETSNFTPLNNTVVAPKNVFQTAVPENCLINYDLMIAATCVTQYRSGSLSAFNPNAAELTMQN
jgi:hypothetical protein